MPHDPIVSRCDKSTRKEMIERYKRDLPNLLEYIDNDGIDSDAKAWWYATRDRRVDLADAFVWREFYDVYEFSGELVMRLVATNFYLVNPRLKDVFNLYNFHGGTCNFKPSCTVESDHQPF